MTWSHTRKAATILFVSVVLGSFIILGNQRQAIAQSGGDIANTVFCIIDGQFENTGTPVHPIFGTECPEGETPTACSDGIDNDGDTFVDLNDPGCADGSDTDETNVVTPPADPACNDGIDNDNDGKIDWGIPGDTSADPGCDTPTDTDETDATPPAPGQCEDGTDNDNDGFTDSNDPNCHTDGDATNEDSYDGDLEESGDMPQCWDGIDNDDDGKTDWGIPGDTSADPDCTTPTDDSEAGSGGGGNEGGDENTLPLCSDGIDNDADEATDLADADCAAYLPKITVVKQVVNDNSGTSTVSDFSLYIGNGVATSSVLSGATSTLIAAGTYTVGEIAHSGYTASFSGDCNASGQVTLAAGDAKTCVITNNDIAPTPPPACADGVDNDEDGKTDMNDPGCSSSEDNDETNQSQSGGGPTPPTGGGGGGGNGPIIGGFGSGPIVGQVLGVTTPSAAACDQFLTAFIKSGAKNDVGQVLRLQYVLKTLEGANIEMTGVYDAATLAALKSFQLKYASEVLTPWGLTAPTGYTYLTTRKKVNEIFCRGTRSFPLTDSEQAVIRATLARGGAVAGVSTTRTAPAPKPASQPTNTAVPAAPVTTETSGTPVETSKKTPSEGSGIGNFFRRLFRRD